MKKKFFVVAAILISSQLQAQLVPAIRTQDTSSLDEVVITANKYPNKTSLTGKVVTVITKEQLERSGGKDLAQILTEQAGIYIGGANSNAGKDKSLYLRGARVDHTLITIDGVPVYDPSGIGSNFDIRNLSIDQIERIEILKGSQSTLYGSDAIAGVINIITKKIGAKPFGTNGLISYGSNNSLRANAGINGKSGVIDYNLAYSFFDTKGINEAISNAPNVDKDGFQQNSLQAGFGLQPTTNIRIQPYLRYNKINGDIDQGAFTDELDYTFTQKSYQAGVRNEITFGKTKLNVLYNYNHIDRLYIDDSVKGQNGFDKYSRGSYNGAEHFIDAYMTTPVGGGLSKLTAGVDFRTSNTNQEYFSVGFYGPYSTKYSADSLHHNQLGMYTALNINTKTGFNLELGNRVNIHSAYGSNYVFNINPSYLLNLPRRQAGNQFKLFANVSSGYRTPSLYQLLSEFGNRDLKPESAFTFEGGTQYFSTNNKFSGRLTGFKRDVKDVIFFYFNPSTFQSQYINQDKQKDHGAELELSFKPTKNISLKAFYSFVDGKITTIQNGKDTTYFNLIRRPKHSFGLNAGVRVNEKFFVSSNLSWFDKRKDGYFDAMTFQTVNVVLDSYILLDVYTEYSFCKNKLKVFADLRNVSNSKYSETAGFNTLGFNGYGGIRYNF
ncbi:MAG TPA: TonB-dependent receptor [Chitinophagaceae bacterium]|jgi:vitamin B12 transporter|nr:TonB-dependent receptor [Chitinophagaceae bacterium]